MAVKSYFMVFLTLFTENVIEKQKPPTAYTVRGEITFAVPP